MFPFVTLSSAA